MADGAARFRQGFSGPALLRVLLGNTCMPNTGLSPSVVVFSKTFLYARTVHGAALQPHPARRMVWPPPRSLATTCGITLVFFSSSYLDVSVRRVGNYCSQTFNLWGFPIRTRADQAVVCTYPRIFAAYRVLRRPQEPRHPPCALIHFLLLPGHIRPSNIIQASFSTAEAYAKAVRTSRLAQLLLPFYFCSFQSCQ